LRKAETTLTVLEPQRAQLTGREAHERVTEILAETLDPDLWAALRLEQGGDLEQASFALPSLGRALDAAAGTDQDGHHEDALWERVVAERDRYWTATGKPSTERVRLAQRLTDAAESVRVVEAELRELDGHTDEMARLSSQALDLAEQQEALVADEQSLVARSEAIANLRRQVQQLESQAEAAVASRERWESVAEIRAGLLARLSEAAESLTRAGEHAEQAEPAHTEAQRRHQEATVARDQAATALRSAEDLVVLTAADSDFRRQEIEIEQFTERRDRVLVQQAALEAAEAELERSRVNADAVAQIETAHLELARAEAAATAGAATVSALALGDTSVALDGETISLAAGDVRELPVSSAKEIVVPGVIAITIRAGAEAQVLGDRLRQAEEHLARLCSNHGVVDLAEARREAQRRADAERVCREATERLAADLRDLTVDAIARKIDRHAQRIALYLAERAESPPLPADLDVAQAVARNAEDYLSVARRQLERRENEVATAVAATNEAKVTNAGLAERVKLDRGAKEQAELSLATARDMQADEAIAEALAAAEIAHQEAQASLAHGRAALALEDPDTLDAVVANARQARQRGTESIAENHDRRQRLGSVLEDRGEQGLAQRRDVALTSRNRLQAERDRLEARASAARVLHETFAARRTEARARYVAPFREKIEKLGRLVFGPTLHVELDDDLRIATRTLQGVTVAFQQLSTGAREQLGVISRLACASIVSGDGGAPVVFDDALGWTDPERLKQMAAAIAVAAADCQVIVLTCTPGRFASVGNATVVRLPQEHPGETLAG
ncbi:MAG: hypothetical protein ABIP03_02990, partial [Aquihabitans sp.]